MEKNRTEILVQNKEYTIVSIEKPEYIQKIAVHVDRKIGELKSMNPALSLEMASVLAAINIVDEYFKSVDTADNLRKQIGEYLDDMAKDRSAVSNLKTEINSLNSQITHLKAEYEKKCSELAEFKSRQNNYRR